MHIPLHLFSTFITADPAPLTTTVQDAEAAEAGSSESKWTGSFTAGMSLTDGNTDIQRASATADAVRELEGARYTLGFQWNYAEEDNELTQRRTYGKAQYDQFISDSSYWLINASLEGDSQADLDLRAILGAGIGRDLKSTDKFTLSGEAGLSYFDEDYVIDADDGQYLAARVAYKWDYAHSDRWSFSQTAEIYPSLEESDDVYAKVDTRAKATLSENMFAQFQWLYDWNNTPAEGKKRVDNLYLITIGWTF